MNDAQSKVFISPYNASAIMIDITKSDISNADFVLFMLSENRSVISATNNSYTWSGIYVLKKQATPKAVIASPMINMIHLTATWSNSISVSAHIKKFKVYPYITATANARRYFQLNLLTTMQRIRRIIPCIRYSVTPTLKNAENGIRVSLKTKAGAAIIETPRSALLQMLTPSATNTIPNIHNNSDDFLIFFIR